jgi:hypothetical protein
MSLRDVMLEQLAVGKTLTELASSAAATNFGRAQANGRAPG